MKDYKEKFVKVRRPCQIPVHIRKPRESATCEHTNSWECDIMDDSTPCRVLPLTYDMTYPGIALNKAEVRRAIAIKLRRVMYYLWKIQRPRTGQMRAMEFGSLRRFPSVGYRAREKIMRLIGVRTLQNWFLLWICGENEGTWCLIILAFSPSFAK